MTKTDPLIAVLIEYRGYKFVREDIADFCHFKKINLADYWPGPTKPKYVFHDTTGSTLVNVSLPSGNPLTMIVKSERLKKYWRKLRNAPEFDEDKPTYGPIPRKIADHITEGIFLWCDHIMEEEGKIGDDYGFSITPEAQIRIDAEGAYEYA